MIGSVPMTVTMSPRAPERKPFSRDRSVRPATMASAKMNSEKYSHGPNWSANLASGTVAPIRKMAPRSPPMHDAQVPSQRARPGWPLRVMGKPSNVVAIAEGVPGIPRRPALTSPPAQPPT